MTNKAPYCAFWWLTITVLSRLQIRVRPKGIHNFAFLVVVLHFSLSTLNCFRPLAPNFIVYKYLRLYICRDTFTNVVSALQIHLFLQNKAKFRKVKLNVNKVLTMDYEQLDTWSIGTKQSQTNPIQTQFHMILAYFSSNPLILAYFLSRQKNAAFHLYAVGYLWKK